MFINILENHESKFTLTYYNQLQKKLVIKEFSSLKAARAFSRILILRNVAREALH
jgi:hypothetical protein